MKTGMERMLEIHRPHCQMHLFHLGEARVCTCGRDEARRMLRLLVIVFTLWAAEQT